MDYETLLKNAPPQDSPEFIEYLRENNEVVYENAEWIIIKNIKYGTPERPWRTVFSKTTISTFPSEILFTAYPDWEWLKKSTDRQTVPGRFHIHIYKPNV